MNCQDISRIANSGRIGRLDEMERRAAETHVRSCRNCAAVWGVQARLAELPVPTMPAELRLRCRALVMAPAHAQNARGPRRLMLVGAVLAIAAAAGILVMSVQGARPPGPGAPLPATAASLLPAPATPVHVVGDAIAPATVAQGEATADAAHSTTALRATLPLIPMPIEPDDRPVQDLALQRLVQRHPELVEGPDLEGVSYLLAAIAMRPDGDVISSAVRITKGLNGYELDHELYRTLPTDAGKTVYASRPKHSKVPDGRSLRGELSLRIVVVPASYNTARSTQRVRDIVGNRYNHLLLPAAGGVLNRLIILLAPDGTILKEKVELERQEITITPIRADDPKDVARVAQEIAKALGTDVNQIGLMGSTMIEDGTIREVGNGVVDDKRRELMIGYAWQRGSGESSPTLRQNGPTKPPVNLASALAIVEQQIPQAFTHKLVSPETYMVVLASNGQFIRAGRITMENSTSDDMAGQLVPGVKTTSFTTLRLTNKAGATVDVRFVWEVPAAEATKPAN